MELLISGYGKEIRKCDEYGNVIWKDDVNTPSFNVVSENLMFTITESPEYSAIYSYVKHGDGFRRSDAVYFDGTALCHIAYSKKHKMIFGACWGTGDLIYCKIDDYGRFISKVSIHQEDAHKATGNASRVHWVGLSNNEDMLTSCNTELDTVIFYDISENGIKEKGRIHTEIGKEPRNAVYNSDETRLYVITEKSNELLVYAMPEMKLLQCISTLEKDEKSESHCSTAVITNDGKVLIAANRYSESLVFYEIISGGTLKEIRRIKPNGNNTRYMILTRNNNFLITAYQFSGEIGVYPLDENHLPVEDKAYKFPFYGAAGVTEL